MGINSNRINVTEGGQIGGILIADLQGTASYSTISELAATASYLPPDVTASLAISASYALTASYISGGFSETSSYALTASYVESSSYTLTASYAENSVAPFPYTGSAIISGSVITDEVVIGDTFDTTPEDGDWKFAISESKLTVQFYDTASSQWEVDTVFTKVPVSGSSFVTYTDTASYAFYADAAGTASYADASTLAETASYISLINGPGITINGLEVSASVLSVNGQFPSSNGNIETSLTAVTTGTSASLEASSSGAVTASLQDGLVWIISQDVDPNLDGTTYIWVSSSQEWSQINSFNYAIADARYLKLAPQAPLQGNLDLGGNRLENVADPTLDSDAMSVGWLKANGSASFASTALYVENAQTASYVATASWSENSISSSFALTASYISGGFSETASYALTASFLEGNVESASYALTASYVANASVDTGSLLTTASFDLYISSSDSTFAGTASLASTASYVENALTASYVENAQSASLAVTASHAITASFAEFSIITVSSSFADTASLAFKANTASFVNTLNQNVNVFGNLIVNNKTTGSWPTNFNPGSGSVAIGSENNVRSIHSLGVGVNNVFASTADNSLANGISNFVSGSNSHVEGLNTTTKGDASHAEGYLAQANGPYSHAEGQQTTTNAQASHAEGFRTITSAIYSHAEGNTTTAMGSHAHSEGENTTAVGTASHAEGMATKALGMRSHAEGDSTTSIGPASHAEGVATTAVGQGSHAEGATSRAVANYSHAEGNQTIALGEVSHTEGQQTTAIGTATHAEGYLTTAKAQWSHAEGQGTIASKAAQHVEGQYNLEDLNALWVVGDGSFITRKNLVAAYVDKLTVTGSLDVNGSITGSLNGTASRAITASYAERAAQVVTIGDAAPPLGRFDTGSLWFNSNDLTLNVRYQDADGGQWVGVTSAGLPTAPVYVQTQYSKVAGVNGDRDLFATNFTTNGNPVEIHFIGDANPLGGTAFCRLGIRRGSTNLVMQLQAEGNINENNPYHVMWIDNPPAGTYTYYLRVEGVGGGTFDFGETYGATAIIKQL